MRENKNKRMGSNSLTLQEDYWHDYKFTNQDLEFLYNHLLEIELPQTAEELSKALISNRIEKEIQLLLNHKPSEGLRYQPGDTYKVSDILVFPKLGLKKGTVTGSRKSNNPNMPTFDVLTVDFGENVSRLFASGLQDHELNQPLKVDENDPAFKPEAVFEQYGETITQIVTDNLESVEDLVRIAGRWFPRALLVDINVGHLNLVEAVLDMSGGGPLPTRSLMEQIELPTDVNSKLTEFSLNLALEEDERFDEVGPAGETLWFLHKLEPDGVREPPITLRYSGNSLPSEPVDEALVTQLINNVIDELEPDSGKVDKPGQVTISLIYPHWRAGTLPITKAIRKLFPAAYEAPRVQFKFIDSETNEEISGWVVRTNKYVFGLRNWYQSLELIPGNYVTITRSDKPGEVLISAGKKKPTREWVRTALIGADGGIVFAMLKQLVSGAFDERMAVVVPDVEALDTIWESGNYSRQPLDITLKKIMKEQTKLNPQGHVHVQELYSAVNLIRRCPPRLILSILQNRPWSNHMGDLYFRLTESEEEI
jgi:hypothetical protein